MDMETPLTVVIFGATGDLAKKKLYPALYQLMFGCPDAPLLPQTAHIVGYARSLSGVWGLWGLSGDVEQLLRPRSAH